jgi:hypothetical protein
MNLVSPRKGKVDHIFLADHINSFHRHLYTSASSTARPLKKLHVRLHKGAGGARGEGRKEGAIKLNYIVSSMADAAREIGSLPVANVQALAETCNNGSHVQVPQRYLTKDPGSEEVVAADDSSHAIPVIDLQKLLESQSSEEECAKLASACLNWGFFQVCT